LLIVIKKMENHKIIRISFEFSFIMENPIPALHPMGMGMGMEKSLPDC
jgi:hypothetical protein